MRKSVAFATFGVALLVSTSLSANSDSTTEKQAPPASASLNDMAARDTDAIDGIRAGGEDPTSPQAGKTKIDLIGSFFDQCKGVDKKNKAACIAVAGVVGAADIVFTLLP